MKFKKKINKKKRNIILKSKYVEKIVKINRVTKVVKGGRKMTFQVIIIVGDKKRKVGIGIGRSDNINSAIQKASAYGKKNIINIPLTFKFSIPHLIKISFSACSILLRPTSEGTGVIAGGSIRTVLELAGLKNVVAKQYGSNNILNNAKTTILALEKLNNIVTLGKEQSSQKYNFYKNNMIAFKNAHV